MSEEIGKLEADVIELKQELALKMTSIPDIERVTLKLK